MIAQNTDPDFKTTHPGQTLWLLDLPDEVLIQVMSHLGPDSIFNAKLVCKHFDDLADQYVYENIKILKGRQAVQLAAAFNRSTVRLNWVKSFLVSTKFGEDSGLTRLPPRLCEMRNLESLRLETPDCNSRQPEERVDWIRLQDMYESVFQQSSLLVPDAVQRKLPHLRECTLHFVDLNVELYSLTRYATIFLHPTLRSLTLSCASTDLPDELREALQNPTDLERTTDLETLFLEECDIHAPSLAYLLKFPRALRSFKFSEGVRYDGLFRTGSRRLHGNIQPHHLMDALSDSCSDTLESLSLSLGYRRHQSQRIIDPGQFLNMTRMVVLKFVEVDYATLQLIKPRVHCDHKTWLRLPRSLETLKICNIHLSVHLPFETRREPHIPLDSCFIRDKDRHGVPKLTTVIYSYDFADDEDEYNEIDDFLLLGNAHLPIPGLLGVDNVAQPPQHHAPNNLNAPVVNLGNAITGPPNVPIHPPQPPVAGVHLPAHLTNNLNLVNPGNHNQAQQFLRQNWFTHTNRGRHPGVRMQREFTQLEMSKIALLRILNNNLLSHFQQHNTRLIVDMVKLPRGFIPPYLYPEDKPMTYSAWWDSNEAKETEAYKREFRLAREAKIFERNLREERDRRRREEELQDLRQRITRGEDIRYTRLPFLTPEQRAAVRREIRENGNRGTDNLGGTEDDNDDEYIDADDTDEDEEYEIEYEEESDDENEDGVEDEDDDDDMHEMPLFVNEGGITVADDGDESGLEDDLENDESIETDNHAVFSASTSGIHVAAAAGDESEGDNNAFVDASVHWTGM